MMETEIRPMMFWTISMREYVSGGGWQSAQHVQAAADGICGQVDGWPVCRLAFAAVATFLFFFLLSFISLSTSGNLR